MKPKKLFISADIEGSCGICHWDETNLDNTYFRTIMTQEVAAACEGAKRAGFDEVLIKDAHDTARNIYPDKLPKYAKIIRNWTRDPFCMVSGIDETFDAAAFTGYHSPAFSSGSPLAHTLSTSLQYIKINGVYVSEFVINAYACALKGVPVAFISGDETVCEMAKEYIPGITVAPVNKGIGGASLSSHPKRAQEYIEEQIANALYEDYKSCVAKLPVYFEVEVQYKKQETAYKNQFFPGAKLINPYTVGFEADNYYSVLVFLHFCA
ncbi:MAG: amino acid amidase [Clostridiales bacterium]|jgi:D-amino peptidase|nr:amino acid amidase [Clostridiales bacterium]